MKRVLVTLFVLSSFAAGCSSTAPVQTPAGPKPTAEAGGGGSVDGGPDAEDGGPSPERDVNVPDTAPVDMCKKMDIVFVVDDSGSLSAAQAKLGANFPRMVGALNAFRTKSNSELDYRLAVTSTDTFRTDFATGGKGGFVTQAACQTGPTRPWLERTDSDVADAFSCRARIGTSGSATEKPLDALLLSITERTADQNRGFLRDDALLAFVILTDEEDSSTATPTQLIRRLDDLKKTRGRWAGSVIAGPKDTNCTSGAHTAYQAPRLHALVEGAADMATGQNNMIASSICQPDFDVAIDDALKTFTAACLRL